MAEEIVHSTVSGEVTMRLWRGDETGGEFEEYVMPAQEGEVVLDVIHRVQATAAPDLACRWNCKAGKCGSCSAEINGRPALMCMTRMDTLPPGETVTVAPLRAFPIMRDLVTDVSYNYEVAKRIPPFSPRPKTADEIKAGGYRMQQIDVERGQEFRKCIECFLCQDVCHVMRDHEENKTAFAGPRFFVRTAELEMHPLDTNDRRELLQQEQGLGQVQHHQVLHRGLPGAHQDHRQRDHPAQGAGGRRTLRPGGLARAQDREPHQTFGGRGGCGVARTGSRGGPAAPRGARDPRAPSRCSRTRAAGRAGRGGGGNRIGRRRGALRVTAPEGGGACPVS